MVNCGVHCASSCHSIQIFLEFKFFECMRTCKEREKKRKIKSASVELKNPTRFVVRICKQKINKFEEMYIFFVFKNVYEYKEFNLIFSF